MKLVLGGLHNGERCADSVVIKLDDYREAHDRSLGKYVPTSIQALAAAAAVRGCGFSIACMSVTEAVRDAADEMWCDFDGALYKIGRL